MVMHLKHLERNIVGSKNTELDICEGCSKFNKSVTLLDMSSMQGGSTCYHFV